jgi:membrane-anchored mycosin MYCP
VAAATLKRVLRLPAVLAVACLALILAAAPPVRAAAGAADRPGVQPMPQEWWFSSWDIQSQVWPLSQGAGVTVAVVDTGVQASLPDLRGVVVPGGDTTGAGTNGMTDSAIAGDGHGTGVAALIAGQGVQGPAGIAPAAKIMPVRVALVGDTAQSYQPASLPAAIEYAVDHGAKVINMSLSSSDSLPSGCDPEEQGAVAYALEHNVVLVAAAGNTGNSFNTPQEPAACAGVLAVGGVNPDLTLWPGSERQSYVAVSAPASEIPFLGLDGKVFADASGTSAATAFVSGEAALIRSRYPSMPWYQVVQRIIGTVLPEGSPVPNDSFGYGIVRIAPALNAAKYKVPASAPNPVYAAFRQWQGASNPQASPSSVAPRSKAPVPSSPAPSSSGPSAGPLAVIAVIAAVVVAGGTALAVVAARRRRRRREAAAAAPAQDDTP